MGVDYGSVVNVMTPEGAKIQRKVEKGFETIDRNVHFVTPVVRIDGVWYEISNKETRRGYREVVKKFDGDRVGSV